eukprot:gnl/Ergobibamus_cyprinoides/1191.p2 GENE.gnl/Ergobibamus_cyprinoides/1191~~gnl/Ergobibamus_cyprinoides/1191.p2  ORF type:complete len:187 (+),score=32.26 gnl/Ergobibamus_cyprinoides/1191:585-1145(+)
MLFRGTRATGGRKFDLRFIVLVRSLSPLRASVTHAFWPRIAPHPYYADDGVSPQTQRESQLTVWNYAAGGSMMLNVLGPAFAQEMRDAGIEWDAAKNNCHKAIAETLRAFAARHRAAGTPAMLLSRCRGFYGADVMMSEDGSATVIEMNFSPDCTRAVKQNPVFFEKCALSLFAGEIDESFEIVIA